MFVELRDGLRLHGSVAGVSDPVLLLHGFTGCIAAWGRPLLSRLTQGHRVVAVDLIGHGASDRPADPTRYALQEVLRDLVELLDHLEIERAHWVGYSMGGRIALAAAVLHPERVRRVVLESASPGLATRGERAVRQESDRALARHLREVGLHDFVERWTAQPLFATLRRRNPDAWQVARERRLDNRADALAACLEGLGAGSQPSFWDRLERVGAAVLVLVGGTDRKFREIGSEMATHLPRATLRVIEGCGHVVHAEEPEAWLAAVSDFLGAADDPGERRRP